jgi:transcriptional regulator with XRE-family HTH domain
MDAGELRRLRMKIQMTQGEFGEALGLTGQFIGMMERGQKPIEVRTEMAARYLVDNTKPNGRVVAFAFRDKLLALADEFRTQEDKDGFLRAMQVQDKDGETFTFQLTAKVFEPIRDCIDNDRILDQERARNAA